VNIAIIGCGLIGNKRAHAAGSQTIALCVDLNVEKAKALAAQFNDCRFSTNWQDAVTDQSIDLIVVATLHHSLAEIALAAVTNGKHVLIEKPGAKKALELTPIIAMAKKTGALVHVGFNHRYHRAVRKAKELVESEVLGELMFVRGRYGHGGRLGYEKEWRAQPLLSGGGELLDQGVHLIDLARWFLGDFVDVQGHAQTYFWNMPVDDNGFLILKTQAAKTAFLHVSCTEWKNLFSFEIYGKKGKIDISGLGGSYGLEKITFYQMTEQMGPPETVAWEYPMPDNSWEVELAEFLDDINKQRQPAANLHDAQAALSIVEEIYRMSQHDYCT
jgi:predicted dehydrogenase